MSVYPFLPGNSRGYCSSRGQAARAVRRFSFLLILLSLVGGSATGIKAAAEITFTGEELLSRPTDTSVTINVVPDAEIELYYEYGTSSEIYTEQTSSTTAPAGEPANVTLSNLAPDTRYFYRMQYRTAGDSWVARPQHSFHTQRARGSTFTFTIASDAHMSGGGGTVSLYQQALANVSADQPDFHFDLGDTAWTDGVTTSSAANQRYLAQRQWMSGVSHSAAIFLAAGNHENEEGWNLDDTNSIALLSINARKRYYPNPIPDSFYSGNPDASLTGISGDHLREDYFAWEWGDALFVFIDPYQYTLIKPFAGTAGGELSDETVYGDRWDWTLGQAQFNWFKQTLENSDARFKFVFAHHGLGGAEDYVRGGAAPAHMFEWGGYSINGTTWGFDTERPGWGGVPIHQLMVANGVSAFFHGHDHVYAYEVRDGVVYQELPSPSMSGSGFSSYYTGTNGTYALQVLPNAGHLRVEVAPNFATVEYVRSNTTGVSHSYTIEPNASAPALGDVNGDGAANSTDALIVLSADADMDTSAFCPMNCGDANADGSVNSTDALIILSYDAGMSVPYPVGTGACPASVTPPPGC